MNFPIETDSATPPQFMTNNLDRAENWREAYRWRCLLMEAEAIMSAAIEQMVPFPCRTPLLA
jgi:hypothetical protein